MAVVYPALCIQVAKVWRSWPALRNFSKQFGSTPNVLGLRLIRMPWLCAYWPVRIDAREGQHRGVVEKVFVNVSPLFTISARRIGMRSMERTSRSSAIRITMFGRQVGVAVGCGAGAVDGTGVAGVVGDPP